MQGRLDEVDLPDLLDYLRHTSSSGRLALKNGPAEKVLWIRAGHLVFAQSNLPSDRLGDMLLQDGRISQSQYDAGTAEMALGKRMGKSLVELEILNPTELWQGVRHQVMEIAYSVIAWDSGLFHFSTEGELGEEVIQVDVPIQEVVLEGIRKIKDRKRIHSRFPDMDLVFSRAPVESRSDLPSLQDHEKYVFKLVNGQRSVAQISRASDIGEFETLKALYIYQSVGYLRIRPVEDIISESQDRLTDARQTLERYNKGFAHCYALLLKEVGPIAENVLEKYLSKSKADHPALLGKCFLRKDGTLGADVLLGNLKEMPPATQEAALKDAMEALKNGVLAAVEKILGAGAAEQARSSVEELVAAEEG